MVDVTAGEEGAPEDLCDLVSAFADAHVVMHAALMNSQNRRLNTSDNPSQDKPEPDA